MTEDIIFFIFYTYYTSSFSLPLTAIDATMRALLVMKQNFTVIYKLLLLSGDTLGLLAAFTLAYIFRVSLDPRPVHTPVPALTYISFIAALLPLWLMTFSLLGLYTKRIYERRPQELLRLFIGAFSGMLLFVTFDFFSTETLFPAKLIPVYAVLLSFFVLLVIRILLRWLRLSLYKDGYGVLRVIIVGNDYTTHQLSSYLEDNLYSGMHIVGIVANKKYIPEGQHSLQYKSLTTALAEANPHAIIQTDNNEVAKVYNQAATHHLDYQLIPAQSILFTSKHSVNLLGAFPVVNIHLTPLIGWGRVAKRGMDVLAASLGILLLSPVMLLIAILIKVTDPKGSVLFRQKRLTRFGDEFNIVKFRSLKASMSGRSPEEVFTEMGRLDLLEEFQNNRSKVTDDPRVSTIGKFIRRTSLDELPQLFNIFMGDISLVGPRAIPKNELAGYEDIAPTVLSVKSGLTGLAQISGRSDISMQERLDLDAYYVQNWSILMDLQIILRTIYMVIAGRGAK